MSTSDPTINNRGIPRTPAPAPSPDVDIAKLPVQEATHPTTTPGQIAEWEPPAVVKLTTQITVEHRKLLHLLERQTGTSLWKLIGHAIDNTYGSHH